MTQVFRQKTVGEQGRIYSRRPQTSQSEETGPVEPAPTPATAASEKSQISEPQALHDFDVGELLLEQFGAVYANDPKALEQQVAGMVLEESASA